MALDVTKPTDNRRWDQADDDIRANFLAIKESLDRKGYDPLDYGAVGDGTTNDTAAFTSIITAINASGIKSGTILLPGGYTFLIGTLTIPLGVEGLVFQGQGMQQSSSGAGSTLMHTAAGAMITTAASAGTIPGVKFKDLTLRGSGASHGHMISCATPCKVNQWSIEDCFFVLGNTAASFIDFQTTSIANVTMARTHGAAATGHTVPIINIVADTTLNVFATGWYDLMINSDTTATAPIFHIEYEGAGTARDHTFINVIFEVCPGGAAHFVGVQDVTMVDCWIADTSSPVDHLVEFSSSSGGAVCSGITFIGCRLAGGGGATYQDLKIAGAASSCTMIASFANYADVAVVRPVLINSTISNNVGNTLPIRCGSAALVGLAAAEITLPNSTAGGLTILASDATEATAAKVITQKNGGTLATPAIVDNNAVLGVWEAYGHDGSGYELGGKAEFKIAGTPSDGTDMPTKFTIYTSAEASSTPTQRFAIAANGTTTIHAGQLQMGETGTTRGAVTLNNGSDGNTAGYLTLESRNGTSYHLFVEDDGTLKIHTGAPANNADGDEVGTQT